MQTIHLTGTEDVRRAGSAMQGAGEDMCRAANVIEEAVRQLRFLFDEFRSGDLGRAVLFTKYETEQGGEFRGHLKSWATDPEVGAVAIIEEPDGKVVVMAAERVKFI